MSSSEQFHNVVSAVYRTSCKTGEGVPEMFADIAKHLVTQNRARMELDALEQDAFHLQPQEENSPEQCSC